MINLSPRLFYMADIRFVLDLMVDIRFVLDPMVDIRFANPPLQKIIASYTRCQ